MAFEGLRSTGRFFGYLGPDKQFDELHPVLLNECQIQVNFQRNLP